MHYVVKFQIIKKKIMRSQNLGFIFNSQFNVNMFTLELVHN